MTPLTCWLQSLDLFNRLAPAADREDGDDLLWPGSNRYSAKTFGAGENVQEVTNIRKADLENHNKDGGLWIVIKVKYFDEKHFLN
jgi:E3 ubiquitin-protein ligase HERC2